MKFAVVDFYTVYRGKSIVCSEKRFYYLLGRCGAPYYPFDGVTMKDAFLFRVPVDLQRSLCASVLKAVPREVESVYSCYDVVGGES